MAVAAARGRADGDEDGVGVLAPLRRQVGGEGQAAFPDVVRDEIVEARLEDRHLAGLAALSIFAGSLSTQVTSWPKSAKQAPDTRPT